MGSSFSSDKQVLSGIPQGSILGPVLFTMYINDLPECVNSLSKIFADDTKVYDDSTKHDKIQQDINSLLEWSRKWQLLFNALKCKVMYFGRKNPKHAYTITSDNGSNVTLEESLEEKDLGVIFDPLLSFNGHVQAVINKANQMLGIIKRTFSYLDHTVFVNLYKAVVRPHLEYANVIWSFPNHKGQSAAIERVQRRATRMLPGLAKLSYENRLKLLKLPSLKYRRFRADMIQTYKIINKIDNIDAGSLFKFSLCNPTRSSERDLYPVHTRLNIRKFSFTNRVIDAWNSLSLTTKSAQNLNKFKNLLDCDQKAKVKIFEYDE